VGPKIEKTELNENYGVTMLLELESFKKID
jgi:hypothetical protein